MSRMLAMIVLLLALSTSGFTASLAVAQEATPTAGADRMFTEMLGLPELAITATADAFEGVPAETAAGRYVVTVTAAPDTEFGAGVDFIMLPEGMAFDEFATTVAGPPAGAPGAADGTPGAEAMASPEAGGGESDQPPEWYYQTYLAGGTLADAGFSSQVMLDLRPGIYAVWGGPGVPQQPVELRVTGEAMASPAAGAEPPTGATITMFEYGFTLDGALTVGPQVLKIANVGAQPHFTILVRPNGPVTKEQVMALLEAEMAGTPTADAAAAAGVSNPDEWTIVGYAGTLSMGATEWITADLEAGTYVLACFVPDIESGMPHAYLGMVDVVTVDDGGTPTA